jgi:hypothetical protein
MPALDRADGDDIFVVKEAGSVRGAEGQSVSIAGADLDRLTAA